MSETHYDPFDEDAVTADELDVAAAALADECEYVIEELPAEGKYEDCVVLGAGFRLSSAGNPMWVLRIMSKGNPSAASDLYVVLTPKAWFRTRKYFQALGIPEPKRGEKTKLTKEDFLYKRVTAIGKHESYEGDQQFKFVELHAPPEGAGARIEVDSPF